MEIQQSFEVDNEQAIGIDGLSGLGSLDKNYVIDDEDINITAISNDKTTITSSISEDSSSLFTDIKSVKKILLSALEEDEEKSYILNDEIMQLLEEGLVLIDEEINKFFAQKLGQGENVNELIDEFNEKVIKTVNDVAKRVKDSEDIVGVLNRIINNLKDEINLELLISTDVEEEITNIGTNILSNIGTEVDSERVEKNNYIFTGETEVFEEESDDLFLVINEKQDEISFKEKVLTSKQAEQKSKHLLTKAESLVKENSNIHIVDFDGKHPVVTDKQETKEEAVNEEEYLEIGKYIDLENEKVKVLISKLKEDNVLKDEFNEEEIIVALYNYVIQEHQFSLEDEDSIADSLILEGVSKLDEAIDNKTILLINLSLAIGVSKENLTVYKDSKNQIVLGYRLLNGEEVELDCSKSKQIRLLDDLNLIDQSEHLTQQGAVSPTSSPRVYAYNGETLVDVRSFIDSESFQIKFLIDKLFEENILTENMDEEDIVVAIYNYIIENYQYISDDESGFAWQIAGSTIKSGGGDCEDLTILYVSLCIAAGVNEDNVMVFVKQGTKVTPGHVVAGYSNKSGQTIALDLTEGSKITDIRAFASLEHVDYNFSFNSDMFCAYSFTGEKLIFEDPHYEESMYVAAKATSQISSEATLDSIIKVFTEANDAYLGHISNLLNFNSSFVFDINIDMSLVTEAPKAFASGNWMSFKGVDFEKITEEFIDIQNQMYIMMAAVILFNEILGVKKMLIEYLFESDYESVKVFSPQRISDRIVSEVGQIDTLISMILEEVMDDNQEAYEYNMEEAKRIAHEVASGVDKKKRSAYENVLVAESNLVLLKQFNAVNDQLISSCVKAMEKIATIKDSWQRDKIWMEVLKGKSVDNNLRVSAKFDEMVMMEQTSYLVDESTADVASMMLKVLFGIHSRADDRANVAALSAAVRSAEKQWIARYSNFLKTSEQMSENIKLSEKQYEDAKRVWDKVKKGPGFFGTIFGAIFAAIIAVASFFTAGTLLVIAAAVIGAVVGGFLGNAWDQMRYQKGILETMIGNLENDPSLEYSLLILDWIRKEYQPEGEEVGEILTTQDMTIKFKNQTNKLIANAWGLIQDMSSTEQINDSNAQVMAMQIMLLAMLAIFDAIADAQSAVIQVLFNVQTKVDGMQVLQTWVNGTFANISSAFDYNASMLFSRAQEHNRKLQVEMQLKQLKLQLKQLESQMIRHIITSIVTVSSLAALCMAFAWIVGIIGGLWGIYEALQSMKEARDSYKQAKKLYEDYKDKFSYGPTFYVPDWLYKGIEAEEGDMGVLYQGLNNAMRGALRFNHEAVTGFLAQMLATLAIVSDMQDAKAAIIAILFGVNMGSQTRLVLANFQAFGMYVMQMKSFEAQKTELSMQIKQILLEAQLAIARAKESMASANKWGWINIGLSVIAVVASAMQAVSRMATVAGNAAKVLSKLSKIISGAVPVLRAITGVMQGEENIRNEEKHIQRMKEAYNNMFSINFDELERGGTNSALTNSAFELVNRSTNGMIKSTTGGRVTYDPSAALAAKEAIKNWQRTWTVHIAIAQSVVEAKQAVMSMLFRIPSTVENFQITGAVAQYQAQAMQIALQLAVAIAKMQVSVWNSVISAKENLAAMRASMLITYIFSALQAVGGFMQIGDGLTEGKPSGSEGMFSEALNVGEKGSYLNKFILSLVTGYGGADSDNYRLLLTKLGNMLRGIIKEYLKYEVEKEARKSFRKDAEVKAEENFGGEKDTSVSKKSLSQLVISNAIAQEQSSFDMILFNRMMQMFDAIKQTVAEGLVDIIVEIIKGKIQFKRDLTKDLVDADGNPIKKINKPGEASPTASEPSEKPQGTPENTQKAPDGGSQGQPETSQEGTPNPSAPVTPVDSSAKASSTAPDLPTAPEPSEKPQGAPENTQKAPDGGSQGQPETSQEGTPNPSGKTDPPASVTPLARPDPSSAEVLHKNKKESFWNKPELKIFGIDMIVMHVKKVIKALIAQRAKTAEIIAQSQVGTSQGANFNSALQGINSNPTAALQSLIEDSINIFEYTLSIKEIQDVLEKILSPIFQNLSSESLDDPSEAPVGNVAQVVPRIQPQSTTEVSTPAVSKVTEPTPQQPQANKAEQVVKTPNPENPPKISAEDIEKIRNTIFENLSSLANEKAILKDTNFNTFIQNSLSTEVVQQISTIIETLQKEGRFSLEKLIEEIAKTKSYQSYVPSENDCDIIIPLMNFLSQKLNINNFQYVITKDAGSKVAHIEAIFTKDGKTYSLDFSEDVNKPKESNGSLKISPNPPQEITNSNLLLDIQMKLDNSVAKLDSIKVNEKHEDYKTIVEDNKVVMDSKETKEDFKLQARQTTNDSNVQVVASASQDNNIGKIFSSNETATNKVAQLLTIDNPTEVVKYVVENPTPQQPQAIKAEQVVSRIQPQSTTTDVSTPAVSKVTEPTPQPTQANNAEQVVPKDEQVSSFIAKSELEEKQKNTILQIIDELKAKNEFNITNLVNKITEKIEQYQTYTQDSVKVIPLMNTLAKVLDIQNYNFVITQESEKTAHITAEFDCENIKYNLDFSEPKNNEAKSLQVSIVSDSLSKGITDKSTMLTLQVKIENNTPTVSQVTLSEHFMKSHPLMKDGKIFFDSNQNESFKLQTTNDSNVQSAASASQDNNIGKIFSSNETATNKVAQLLTIDNPTEVVKYVVENPAIVKDIVRGEDNRTAIISYLVQEERVNSRDKVEFNNLLKESMKVMSSVVGNEKLVEEMVQSMLIVPQEKLESSIVKTIVLLEDLVQSNVLQAENISEKQISLIAKAIQETPEQRNATQIANILEKSMSDTTIVKQINKEEAILGQTSVISKIAETMPQVKQAIENLKISHLTTNDSNVQAAASASQSIVGAPVSNNQSLEINSTPVVAQAKQTFSEFVDIKQNTQITSWQAIDNIREIIESVHFPVIVKEKKDTATLANEEQAMVQEVVKQLEHIKQQLPIAPELIKEVSKNDLRSRASVEKLLEVTKSLIELIKEEKDSNTKVQLQTSVENLKTTLETISLVNTQDNNIGKIFSSNETATNKVAQLLTIDNPTEVVKYVVENPFVINDLMLGQENIKALLSFLLQKDKLNNKDESEFNFLTNNAIQEVITKRGQNSFIKDVASVIAEMPSEKHDSSLIKAITLLELISKKSEIIFSKEDISTSNLISLLSGGITGSTGKNSKEIATILIESLFDEELLELLDKNKELLPQISVIKSLASELPEVRKLIESFKVQDLQVLQKQRQDVNLVGSNVRQIDGLKPLLDSIQAKENEHVLQSINSIQKTVNSFYSPFVNYKENTEISVNKEKNAISSIVNSIEKLKDTWQVPADLTKTILDYGLNSMQSIDKLAEFGILLKEAVTKEENSLAKIELEENIIKLAETIESVKLSKDSNGEVARIFNGLDSVSDKISKLLEINNPIAIARYVKDNLSVLDDPLLDSGNRKAFINFVLQEDQVNVKDMAEFKTLIDIIMDHTLKKIDEKQIVEESLVATSLAEVAKSDKVVTQALILLEEMVSSGFIQMGAVQEKMSDLLDIIKYNPVPRSNKEISELIHNVVSSPSLSLGVEKTSKNILEETKVIKAIAEKFNIENIPAINVLGINGLQQHIQQNIKSFASEDSVPDRSIGMINSEDIQEKNFQNVIQILGNIHEAIDENWQNIMKYIVKNLEQLPPMNIIVISDELKSSFKKFKSKKDLDYDTLLEVIEQIDEGVSASKLTKGQEKLLFEKTNSLRNLISNVQQIKGKEQKIFEIFNNTSLSVEEKIQELTTLRVPEKVLECALRESTLTRENRLATLGFISSSENRVANNESFVLLAEQILVSMKLTPAEKSEFVLSIQKSIKNLSSSDTGLFFDKILSLLDMLVASGQFDRNVSKEIIPLMVSSLKKEEEQVKLSVLSKIISNMRNPNNEALISQMLLQNFPDLKRQIVKTTRGYNIDVFIEKLPIEVLANDTSDKAIKSVINKVINNESLLDNEKVRTYVDKYISDFLTLNSWDSKMLEYFLENIQTLLLNNKGQVILSKIIDNLISSYNVNPQEKFVAVLKILSLYEANLVKSSEEAKQLILRLQSEYNKAIEYLLVALPTLEASIIQALGYLSKITREELRKRVESSLKNGPVLLKRSNEIVLWGLEEISKGKI